jgi:hypothetical protein
MPLSFFASNLTVLRKHLGFAVSELSVHAAIAAERIALLESGAASPTPNELIQLCTALSISLDGFCVMIWPQSRG